MAAVAAPAAVAVAAAVAVPAAVALPAAVAVLVVVVVPAAAAAPVLVNPSSENDRGGSCSSSSAESASAERIVSWPRAGSRWLRVRASERRERGRRSGRPGCGFGGRAVTPGSRVALQRPLLAAAAAELG